MSRGYSVLKHPEKYSKKQVERALNRQAAKKKKLSTIERAMSADLKGIANLRPKPEHVTVIDMDKPIGRSRWDILHFDKEVNEYYLGSMKINMFDADNAAEVVRRFNNSGDA